jgi:hypothetical protein
LALAVTEHSGGSRDNACMKSFDADRTTAFALAAANQPVDDHLRAMHVRYHDKPREHVGVHATWMRIEFRRRAYHRALFHAFAGFVVAGPASLVQRYTGLVVPAFKARD